LNLVRVIFAVIRNIYTMKRLLLLLSLLSLIGCTTTSRIYDSDYNQTNREIINKHLLHDSKAIPNVKLTNETLDSTSYKLEYSQGENCSGYVEVKRFSKHELKVVLNYGCVDLKHKSQTLDDFLDELGGLLH
jgi:hypothetical protein